MRSLLFPSVVALASIFFLSDATNLAVLAQSSGSKSSGAPLPGDAAGVKAGDGVDYTERLKLVPGLTVVFSIFNGVDSHHRKLGDYSFTARIDDVGEQGFAYHWKMSPPADAKGMRAVSPEDMKESRQLSLFYENDQHVTMEGFTSLVRVSDALFKDMKNGSESTFAIDLDDKNVPSMIRPVSLESVDVLINGRREKVRAIKTETDNGWNYWILDNPDFPVVVQGEGPFIWKNTSFKLAALDFTPKARAAPPSKPELETKKLIDDLEAKGKATSHQILFAFNSAELAAQSQQILDGVADYLKSKPAIRLSIEGHCDNIGTASYNQKLSERRAEAVRGYLISQGVKSQRLTAKGFGFSRPVADNGTEKGRALNRRVVFNVIP